MQSNLFDTSALADEANRLVEAAGKAGADAADAVAARSQSLGVEVRLGKVEETERSENDRMSLRVFVGNRSATIGANRLDDVAGLAERAVAMARVSPENPYAGLAPQDRLATDIADLDMLDETIPAVGELEAEALECEAAALAISGITNSGGAASSWGVGGLVLATSHGFTGAYINSHFSRSVSVIAEKDGRMERDYDYDSRVHRADLRGAAEIGRSAAERTVKRLGPRQIATTTTAVMFDPRVANSLVGHFAGAINGASIARRTSFLREMLGQSVFSPSVTIVDDPLMRRGPASHPFDGEGVACAALTLAADGVLNGWLLDRATAAELGMETNGRASRGGGGLSPASTNLAMQPGAVSAQEMMKAVDSGFYVTELIGQGVNLVTGDYSRGASGFRIENGELSYPVSEVTIAGNLLDMFMRLVPANDLEYRYRTNAPTILIEDMTLAGT